MAFSVLQALVDKGFEEVSYKDFYRNVFPAGSFEEKGVYKDGEYNGIIVEIEALPNGKEKVHRHTLTDDLEKLDEITSRRNFCLMSPISYAGKSRKSENARYLYAMAIDVDGIKEKKHFDTLMWQADKIEKRQAFAWGIPNPTYIISSGTGIHLYYVFKQPVALFPNVVPELEKLKRRLTWQAWTQGASTLHDSIQYESLFQGFRVVGTTTKKGDTCRAFKYGNGEKVTIEYLNSCVPQTPEFMAVDFSYKSRMSLEEAKEKYPDWYEKRIVNKVPRGCWQCKKALYDWWKGKTIAQGEPGHRYWCVFTLAVYARKCGVSYEQLVEDALEVRKILDSKGDGSDPFTVNDVMHALEAYNDSYITYPRKSIEYRTDIRIDPNKRNGRTQEKHLQGARAIRDINNENWREGNGRKSKFAEVIRWKEAHPDGTMYRCQKETGLDKKTIRKYWGAIKAQKVEELSPKM